MQIFKIIGVAGLGAMGGGIVEVAARAGCKVIGWDANPNHKLPERLAANLQKSVDKGQITGAQAEQILQNVQITTSPEGMAGCDLVIEAIVEQKDIKSDLFRRIEMVVAPDAILASNTSSLSIASLGAVLKKPERFLGIHFFNPATLMKLVEIIPGVATKPGLAEEVAEQMKAWGKITVLAKDTPGFIVNRIARPFYGEALRMYEEGLASIQDIDSAMKMAGFKMGPFELMDFIGNDINFAVTESVFREFWFDPRYKPSFTQKRLVEAGRLGRKTGQGYYTYPKPAEEGLVLSEEKARMIQNRILAMLMNEAADACYLGIASAQEIDWAMQYGVNYPKGLLHWADEWGVDTLLHQLDELYQWYHEDRYRASPLLRSMHQQGKRFFHG